jgi:hypothetical protein
MAKVYHLQNLGEVTTHDRLKFFLMWW